MDCISGKKATYDWVFRDACETSQLSLMGTVETRDVSCLSRAFLVGLISSEIEPVLDASGTIVVVVGKALHFYANIE